MHKLIILIGLIITFNNFLLAQNNQSNIIQSQTNSIGNSLSSIDPSVFHLFNSANSQIRAGRVVNISGVALITTAQIMSMISSINNMTNNLALDGSISIIGFLGMLTYNIGLPIMGAGTTRMARASRVMNPEGYYHNPGGWISYGVGWGLSIGGFALILGSTLSDSPNWVEIAVAGAIVNLCGIAVKGILSWVFFEITAMRNKDNILSRSAHIELDFNVGITKHGGVVGSLSHYF